MSTPAKILSAERGLYLLTHTTAQTIVDQMVDEQKIDSYPFSKHLPTPTTDMIYVDGSCTERSVELFLAGIRMWVNNREDGRVRALRIISIPRLGATSIEERCYFYQMQLDELTVISSGFLNCSGASKAANQDMEDVFELLALVHKVEVGRTDLDEPIDIHAHL